MKFQASPDLRFLLILLPLFGMLALNYSFATPPFEAPDEAWHYAYVRWLAAGHGLPALNDDASGANQEVAQPPLYYAVAALLSAPFADDDLPALFWHNPHFGYQAARHVPDNKNMLIHTAREAWPWRGAVLAVRMTRLASLLFGLLTIAAAYGLARETLPTARSARQAALLVALTPQFLFLSGVVSNDSAAAALATATLWALARALKRGFTVRRSLLSGALIGLAALTKVSNLALGGLALLALLYADVSARRTPTTRLTELLNPRRFRLLTPLLALGLAALLTGGWWYARNLLLYADPLALRSHTGQLWARSAPASLMQLLAQLPTVYRSFWGAFGWGHIEFAPWVYWALALLPLSSLAGWLWLLKSRRAPAAPAPLLLAATWCVLVGGAFLIWLRTLDAPHGRLLFPALGAGAVLLAAGWEGLRMAKSEGRRAKGEGRRAKDEGRRTKGEGRRAKDEGRRTKGTHDALPMTHFSSLITYFLFPISYFLFPISYFLFLLNLLAPLLTIRPAFAPPRLMTPAAAQATVTPTDLTFGDAARLLGIALTHDSVAPGDALAVRACWMALAPMSADYTVFIHLIGAENSRPGERYTYPGLGRFPTSLWPVGEAFCDVYAVPVAPWAAAPELDTLLIGLLDAESGLRLPASGEPPAVAQVRVASEKPPALTPSHPLDAHLGEAIVLRGYDTSPEIRRGGPLTVTLYWQAAQNVSRDYKVFVQWLDADNTVIAQHDGVPRAGRYPTTAWRAGDVVPDTHTLITETLPAGPLRLIVGMYDAVTLERLPVNGGAGGDFIQLYAVEGRP